MLYTTISKIHHSAAPLLALRTQGSRNRARDNDRGNILHARNQHLRSHRGRSVFLLQRIVSGMLQRNFTRQWFPKGLSLVQWNCTGIFKWLFTGSYRWTLTFVRSGKMLPPRHPDSGPRGRRKRIRLVSLLLQRPVHLLRVSISGGLTQADASF